MRPLFKPLVPLVGLAACAALTACSFSVSAGGQSPTEGVTGQIEEAYEDQTGIALRDLSCDEVEAEENAAIRCEGVNARGVELLIGGEISNVEGDEFDYHWDVRRAIAPGSLYAEAAVPVVERLTGEAIAGVRCEKRVEVTIGRVVRCQVKAGSGEIVPIRLRVTDEDGGFDVVTKPDSGFDAATEAGNGTVGA